MGRVKKEAGNFSKRGSIASRERREWYHFNLPRGNLVNNRSNYPARWHEEDDPVKRLAQLFYVTEKKKKIFHFIGHDGESISNMSCS